MSDAEVIELDCITRLDVPPTRILANAADAKLKTVVVIGKDEDGDFYFASSVADGGDANWLLDVAKRKLMDICEP